MGVESIVVVRWQLTRKVERARWQLQLHIQGEPSAPSCTSLNFHNHNNYNSYKLLDVLLHICP